MGEVAVVARAERPRPAALRRDEAVVAVHQPLVAERVAAAPLVAGEAGLHRGQARNRVRAAVRALALHRRVAAAVDRPLAVREVARGAAGGVPVAVERLVLPRDVAARAELPVEVAREVVELGDGRVLHLRAVERVRLARGRCVGDARPLALPGRLDLPDHPGVGEHLVAVHPLDLVAVARLAAELPAARVGRVGDAVDALVRGFLRGSLRVAAVAGDAALVRRRRHLDSAVAAQAARVGLRLTGSDGSRGCRAHPAGPRRRPGRPTSECAWGSPPRGPEEQDRCHSVSPFGSVNSRRSTGKGCWVGADSASSGSAVVRAAGPARALRPPARAAASTASRGGGAARVGARLVAAVTRR